MMMQALWINLNSLAHNEQSQTQVPSLHVSILKRQGNMNKKPTKFCQRLGVVGDIDCSAQGNLGRVGWW
jgi:hypothetical protein